MDQRLTRRGLITGAACAVATCAYAYDARRLLTLGDLRSRNGLLAQLQERVRRGQRARWGLVGDSLTAAWGSNGASVGDGNEHAGAGSGANFRRSLSPSARLGAALTAMGVRNRTDMVCGTYADPGTDIAAAIASYSPRLVAEASWYAVYGPGVVGGGAFRTAGSDSLILTPDLPADSCEVMAIEHSSSGSFSVSDSSGVLVTRTTGTANANVRVIATRPTPSLEPFKITRTSGGIITINGIVPFDSTRPCIELWNMGWAGAKASDWIDKTSGYAPGFGLAQFQADHFTIELGGNDRANSVSTATYKTNMLALINILKAVTPSVGLIKPSGAIPAGDIRNIGAGYSGAIDELTAEQGLRPAIDLWQGITLSPTDYFDRVHLVASGYQKKADKLLASIR